QIRIFVHRQVHQLHVARLLLDLPPGLEAVEKRHGDVEHDDIGVQRLDRSNESAAVTHLTDDLALPCQQFLERAENERVIVGQENSRLSHNGDVNVLLFRVDTT